MITSTTHDINNALVNAEINNRCCSSIIHSKIMLTDVVN